jgi:hypothetical protein
MTDKAFDADELVIQPLQPATINRDDEDLCRAWHLIENFFAGRKQFRAIATRYHKLAANLLARPISRPHSQTGTVTVLP